MKTCLAPSCDRRLLAKGLCSGHYQQQRDGKALRPVGQGETSTETAARFWAKVNKEGSVRPLAGDRCWEWTAGMLPSGYGTFRLSRPRRRPYAHRFSYELHAGPIPPGMFVCHSCDNPPCVNPAHLFLGTVQDNVDDMKAKGRGVGGCGHPMAKYTDAEIDEMRRRRADGGSVSSIARAFGASVGYVSAVLRNLKRKPRAPKVSP